MISTWVWILWRTCPAFGSLEGYQWRDRPKATKRRTPKKEMGTNWMEDLEQGVCPDSQEVVGVRVYTWHEDVDYVEMGEKQVSAFKMIKGYSS